MRTAVGRHRLLLAETGVGDRLLRSSSVADQNSRRHHCLIVPAPVSIQIKRPDCSRSRNAGLGHKPPSASGCFGGYSSLTARGLTSGCIVGAHRTFYSAE